MIRYTLRCAEGHEFESWFQSSSAFDALADAGHVSCVVCGSSHVAKGLMAPKVSTKDARPLSSARSASDRAIAALRKHLEANSTYVGRDFAREARAMHLGDAPQRPIWGEARGDVAKSLIDDGVPIAPLPFAAKGKAN